MSFHFAVYVEITAFSDRYEEFQKLNTEVLGVSVDSVVSDVSMISWRFLCLESLHYGKTSASMIIRYMFILIQTFCLRFVLLKFVVCVCRSKIEYFEVFVSTCSLV